MECCCYKRSENPDVRMTGVHCRTRSRTFDTENKKPNLIASIVVRNKALPGGSLGERDGFGTECAKAMGMQIPFQHEPDATRETQ